MQEAEGGGCANSLGKGNIFGLWRRKEGGTAEKN